MAAKSYEVKLTSHQVLEVILALAQRQERVGVKDASLADTCASVRAQLNNQGAFEDIASWYGRISG